MFNEYISINNFYQSTLLKIDEGKLSLSLLLVSKMVEKIISDPVTVSQGNGSLMLDDLCQRIGSNNLKLLSPPPHDTLYKLKNSSNIIYVVTKIQKSGGHTRFIVDLIESNPNSKHIILSTELLGTSDIDYLENLANNNNNVTYELSDHKNYLIKLNWLQRRLFDFGPCKVYLINHHQDSVAVSAIQQSMGLDVSFCHHADHSLSLGVYLPNVSHIDLHTIGYYHCRHVLGIHNTYLPLVTKDLGNRGEEVDFMSSGFLITCTVGRANKIEPPYFIDYCDVIPRLLKITKGKHIHIGRLTPLALIKIHFYMVLNQIEFNKFKYVSFVPSVWKALQENKVDLYISSFPYVGLLTLIEAMGSGTPVVIHKHIFSRILSGIDVAHPEAPKWRFPEELFDICRNMTREKLMIMSKDSRKHYEKFHKSKFLKDALHDVITQPSIISEINNFQVQNDELALWLCNQNSIKNFIKKKIVLIGKRLFR